MTKSLEEIHPGEVLLEDFLKPMGITASELAIDLGGPVGQINELVHGMHPITPDIALRLGRHFKMDPVFWVSLQTEYDTRVIDTCQGWKEVDAAWPDH